MKYIILFFLIFIVKSESSDFIENFELTNKFTDLFNNFDPILGKFLSITKEKFVSNCNKNRGSNCKSSN